MTHARESLLVAFAAQIVAGATSVGSRVYRGRRLGVANSELPACCVYQGEEDSGLNDVNTLKVRETEVIVELHQESDPTLISEPDIETALNAIAEEIENVIEADQTIGGACLWVEQIGTGIEVEQGDRDRGVLRLVFKAHYRTLRTDAGTVG